MKQMTQKKIDDIAKEIERCKKAYAAADEAHSKTWDEEDNDAAVIALREALKKAEEKHRTKRKKLEEERNFYEKKKWKLQAELGEAKLTFKYQEGLKNNDFDEKGAQAFLSLIGAKNVKPEYGKGNVDLYLSIQNLKGEAFSDTEYFTLKTTCKNGIKVFQNKTYWHNTYFAFKGIDLVGVWRKRLPEHQGDETRSNCWMDVDFMNDENELSRDGRFRRESQSRWSVDKTDARYIDWKNALEAADADKLRRISVTDIDNLRRMGAQERVR